MALLTFSSTPVKGGTVTVTLDKSYLVSMQAVSISDSYFTDPLNIKDVVVVYESEPGKQKYNLNFDFSQAEPSCELEISANARNNFYFTKIVLNDFEGDKLKLSREQIVLSDESIVDLDISFGPMEETNEIVVTPPTEGVNLYEDFAEQFLEKNPPADIDMRQTVRGELTILSSSYQDSDIGGVPVGKLTLSLNSLGISDIIGKSVDGIFDVRMVPELVENREHGYLNLSSPGNGDAVTFNAIDSENFEIFYPFTSSIVDIFISMSGNLGDVDQGGYWLKIGTLDRSIANETALSIASVHEFAFHKIINLAPAELDEDAVNLSQMNETIAFALPAGVIMPYAGSTAPGGYELCAGQALLRSEYAALFAVIGTTYGAGNGVTTFNVPDLRGRAAFGLDNMGGTATNRVTSGGSGIDGTTIGTVGGEETHILTTSELAGHTHSINHDHASFTTASGGTHTHTLTLQLDNWYTDGGTATSLDDDSTGSSGTATYTTNANQGAHTHSIDIPAYTGTSGSAGGGGAHNNMPPAMMLNYIIKC